jgi:aminopeptidase
MTDLRIEKLAQLLVTYSADVKAGNKVVIGGEVTSAPLLREIYRQVLLHGAFPYLNLELPGADYIFYKYANDEQLQFIHYPTRYVVENYDRLISILGEQNTKSLNEIDSKRMVLRQRANESIMKTYLARAASGEMKWSLSLFPTDAYAQDAGMSLEAYEDFVYSAILPDMADPVGYWKKFSAKQQQIVEWFKGKHEVHVRGPETDLQLRIDNRPFINCDCHENLPDGEVFTGPVEESVEGFVRFSYPAIYNGHEINGVRLWFEKGRVVRATADKNEEFLLQTIETDEGAHYVGEFAIGTNEGIQKFTRNILFDEKIGGSFHMALGAGYPESGSKNDSAIHWDMICDLREGGEIIVDGEVLYRNGEFLLNFTE